MGLVPRAFLGVWKKVTEGWTGKGTLSGFIRVVGARCAQCWDLQAAKGSSEKMGVLAVLVVPGGQTEV